MKRYILAIADSSEDIREAMRRQFEPFCQVYCCSTGPEVLELIAKAHPDVLLLDLMLPMLDGLSLLTALAAAGDCMRIAGTSAYISPYLLQMAEDMGVSCLFQKPFDLREAEIQIRSLLEAGSSEDEEERYRRVSSLLLRLGFPAKLRGYSYLREAVLQYVRDPGQSIIKELYPRVGSTCGVSALDVERSIRSAAVAAWSCSPRSAWTACFPLGNPRPSNAELIQGLAGLLTDYAELPAAEAL